MDLQYFLVADPTQYMPNWAIQHLYIKSVLKVLQKFPNLHLEDILQLLKEESIQLSLLIEWSVTNAHRITPLDSSVLEPKAFSWSIPHFLTIPFALQPSFTQSTTTPPHHLCPTFLNTPYPPVSAPCSHNLPTVSEVPMTPELWNCMLTSNSSSICFCKFKCKHWHGLLITPQGRCDPNPSLSPAHASPFLHYSTGFGVHPARYQV